MIFEWHMPSKSRAEELVEGILERLTLGPAMARMVLPMTVVAGSINIPFRTRDRNTAQPLTLTFAEWIPTTIATVTEAFEFVRTCLRRLAEHEIDESIRVDGVLVRDPHSWNRQEDIPPRPAQLSTVLVPTVCGCTFCRAQRAMLESMAGVQTGIWMDLAPANDAVERPPMLDWADERAVRQAVRRRSALTPASWESPTYFALLERRRLLELAALARMPLPIGVTLPTPPGRYIDAWDDAKPPRQRDLLGLLSWFDGLLDRREARLAAAAETLAAPALPVLVREPAVDRFALPPPRQGGRSPIWSELGAIPRM